MKKIALILATFWASQTWALPNPAALNCTAQKFQYVMIQNTGICIFNDETYCEEWAFFRGECKAGENHFPGDKFIPENISTYCIVENNKVVICNN